QQIKFLRILDAFGHNLEAETVSQVYGGAHDGCAIRVFVHVRHERTVDFQLGDRQPHDVAQRGVTRTIVVDGYFEADRRQAFQASLRVDGVIHEPAFRDFQTEHRGRYMVLREKGADRFRKIAIHQVPCRDIDGYLDMESAAAPLAALPNGFTQHPAGQY